LPAIDHILILRDGIARLYGTRDEVLSRLDAPRSIAPEQRHLENEAEQQAHQQAQLNASVASNRAANPVLAGAA
jgi:ABC-type protease/lipase transport system fused ATPase/permease subunit